ncbi:MAG: GNAT family N-acetyltransferase [Clostridia bacterium]|nr:GNAT family N-acetyltransferase [Clostridia bacterium]
MKYIARRFRLRSGGCCVLRSPEPRDAAQRAAFLKKVNAETDFMARGAGDTPEDLGLIEDMLQDQLDDERSLEIAAFVGDEMIACGGINPAARAYPRKRHRAQFGICVLKEYWSEGLGTAILQALIAGAGKMGYAQMELTVVSGNERARRLYVRCGFEEAGRMPDALLYEDGTFRDEIWMVRKL